MLDGRALSSRESLFSLLPDKLRRLLDFHELLSEPRSDQRLNQHGPHPAQFPLQSAFMFHYQIVAAIWLRARLISSLSRSFAVHVLLVGSIEE